jgi:proteasome lid subunit RPN8/RPN11
MIDITPALGQAIFDHAKVCFPRESCGLLVELASRMVYEPCSNIAPADAVDRFVIAPLEWARAEDAGEIRGVVHSHPNACANPSHADVAMCERTGLPWVIIGVPSGVIKQIEPTGQPMPLVGRDFHHGIVDCYTLIRDYYSTRLGIKLPDFPRDDEWWVRGDDLYVRQFKEAGFVQVGGLEQAAKAQPNDVVLMQVAARQTNHAAILDAQKPGEIIHHLYGRLSGHDVWGGDWHDRTTHVLRHQCLLGVAHV